MTTYTYTESTIPNQISSESGDPNQAMPGQEIQIKSIPNHGAKLTTNNIESMGITGKLFLFL